MVWPVSDVELVGTAGAAVTIVDANLTGAVVNIPLGATATIHGVTLRNGQTTTGVGAGIHNAGTLTLRNSTVSGNKCFDGNGGVGILSSGSLTLINSTVSNNQLVGGYGGGAGIRSYASATLIDSTVSGNSTTSTPGGGLLAASGSVTLVTTRIENNVTGSGTFLSGAGLYVRDALSVSLTNCTVSGNIIAGAFGGLSGVGAGMFVCQTPFSASASTFAGNSASYRAGGIFAYKCNSTELRNCTISDNSGTGLLTVVAVNSSITVLNCTIAGNASSYDCGGFSHTSPGVAQVRNTLTAGNSGNFGVSPDLDCAFPSLGHNLIDSSVGVTGFTIGVLGDQVGVANPGLAPLANNGGPTQTRALSPGRPAINAGDLLVFELFDQRGAPRSAGSAAIGAFESQSTATYCSAGTSSNGCVALISSSGTASASAASGFTISVASVPGQRQA
ncbi:MAG: right-handed parallel beta-helix repeat-containing protein [Planctomycetes bacterium]|nr:right-handed parallel beta-helix repeat-containing protein [Planctomycetota bacterium]